MRSLDYTLSKTSKYFNLCYINSNRRKLQNRTCTHFLLFKRYPIYLQLILYSKFCIWNTNGIITATAKYRNIFDRCYLSYFKCFGLFRSTHCNTCNFVFVVVCYLIIPYRQGWRVNHGCSVSSIFKIGCWSSKYKPAKWGFITCYYHRILCTTYYIHVVVSPKIGCFI